MNDKLNVEANNCPLCNHAGDWFYEGRGLVYYECSNCSGIFMGQNFLPSITEEKHRYEEHNNDVNDIRFQKFVSPITSAIQNHFSPSHVGLDFGAGTGPVITKVLTDNNYQVESYDPIFHNYPKLLEKDYDYIASCEVIEHFHNPLEEFKLLKTLLKPNGKLFCMTHINDEHIDFPNWYYKNDPTHVFFYHADTIQWIKESLGFSAFSVKGKLITLSV